jgi:uncharacterized delta-60 repeat protein
VYAAYGRPSTLKLLDTSGAADPSFTPVVFNGNGSVKKIKILPDGRLITVGDYTSANGFAQGAISRINLDGSVDLSFNNNLAGANRAVNDVAVTSSGQFVIGGWFTTYDGVSRMSLAVLNSNGTLDTTFTSPLPTQPNNQFYQVNDVEVLPNGKILAGLSGPAPTPPNILLQLNTDGSIDRSNFHLFGPGGIVRRLAAQPDGKVLVSGSFTHSNLTQVNSAIRLNSDGTLDTSFAASTNIYPLIVQPDGKILAGSTSGGIVRLNSDGLPDATFINPYPSGSGVTINDAVLTAGGKIVIGGFQSSTGLVVRLNPNGSVDGTFTSSNLVAQRILVQPDGKFLVGGGLAIIRLNADGSTDPSFPAFGGTNGAISDIALQSNGGVIVAGSFTAAGGSTSRKYLARLNPDGSWDATFQSVIARPVTAVIVVS